MMNTLPLRNDVNRYLLALIRCLLLLCTISIPANASPKDWTLKNLKGENVTLSNYRGQPVVLVFWATWCPYCKTLLPGIEKMYQDHKKQGLVVLAVNIKEDWKPKVYWQNHEYSFDALLNGDNVANIYNIKGTPGLVFISPKGHVVKTTYFSSPEHPLLTEFPNYYLSPEKTSALSPTVN